MGSANKHICVSFCILLMFISGVYAQNTAFGNNVKEVENTRIQPLEKGFAPEISLQLGTVFTSFAPGYNAFGTFIAPEFLFPITNRFAVSAGIGYTNIFYPGNQGSLKNNTMNYGSIYVSGSYKMTEKLTISGTGYKTFLLNPPEPIEGQNVSIYDNSNQGVILNMDYKVNKSFHINASFQIHQQNGSPYYWQQGSYVSPFNHMGGFSPFYNDGFYP